MLTESVIIAVDFDGTITKEKDITKNMTIQHGAKETLKKLYEDGCKLILWTCRSGDAYDDAIDFLYRHDIFKYFTTFNDQLPEVIEKYQPDVSRKVGADIYIDDKAVGAIIDWEVIYKQIQEQIIEGVL